MNWKWYLFSFKGRVNRALFWAFAGPLGLIIIFTEMYTVASRPGELSTPTAVLILVTLWPSLAIQAKRWHDTDRSAWWILINFVPLIGGIWALVVTGAFPGTQSENRFGPPFGSNAGDPIPDDV